MSHKLGKLNRRTRIELVKSWKVSVFPATLLVHGPPPTEDNYRHWRDYSDERSVYFRTVETWYAENFLSQYRRPSSIVDNLRMRFRRDYEEWWIAKKEASNVPAT